MNSFLDFDDSLDLDDDDGLCPHGTAYNEYCEPCDELIVEEL
jgi:hypothetical protein